LSPFLPACRQDGITNGIFLRYRCKCVTAVKLKSFLCYSRYYFNVVRKIFNGIHLGACYGTNEGARGYCAKAKTRQEEFPFFEYGDFVEEGERTDTKQFALDSSDMSLSITDLHNKYPMMTLQYLHKVEAMRQHKLEELYGHIVRDVKVTYIYGKSRVGKTTYHKRVLGYATREIAKVGKYNSTGQFDQYNMQDIIIFDEFKSQIPLTEMNEYIEGESLNVPARHTNRVACYTKVFIMSNYPLSEQYEKARADGDESSYEAFCKGIHEIIYMAERNHYIWQKGQPTAEVIARLTEQGAKITMLPEKSEQTEMQLISVNADELPF